ncbi:DNA repair protein RecO [Candidatus Uhrbacteria bacterium]|nr:DNA repair protein RecO [Candidatus Uhrbacteria bacterium]
MFDSQVILLRKRVFRENDYLLTFFTQHEGKKTLLGRGMQNMSSKLAPHCADFFVVSRIRWVPGKSFDTITSATAEQSMDGISTELLRIGVGFQVLESLDRWTRDDNPEPQLWNAVMTVLQQISTSASPWLVVQAFFVRALALLGWKLQLDRCLVCQSPVTAGARLNISAGGVWCTQQHGVASATAISQNDINILKYLQSDQWNTVSTDQVKPLLPIIRESIDLHRERPWSSDQWVSWVGRHVYARA